MFLCGAETPIVPNPQLYELNEKTGMIELASACLAGVNRYSLLWLGAPSNGTAAAQRIFLEVLRNDTAQATWCAVWMPRSDGNLAGQSMIIRRQHERDGWEIFADQEMVLAAKPAVHDAISWASHQHRSKLLLFIGEGVKVSLIARSPARASLIAFARSRMAPSCEAIAWLKAMSWSIAYPEHDNIGRSGFVIVGPRRFLVDELERAGFISETRWGECASTVWMHPPSGDMGGACSA